MMKRFKFLAIAASALMALTACTTDKLEAYNGQPDTNPESQDNAITFGTYTSKSRVTRAGFEGSIDNSTLQASNKANGFGVFAYYTGKNNYNDKNGASATLAPNFMYNEHITYSSSAWTYTNTKYWPNEVGSGAVDDQENDSGSDPATTTNENGGNVTFFAYAPYVEVYTATPTDASDHKKADGTTAVALGDPKVSFADAYDDSKKLKKRGITAITDNTTQGDPKITYTIASDGKIVDLLWGTKGSTTENVLGAAQAGVTGTSEQAQPVSSRSTYQEDLLKDMTTNADLTKQKTNGKVDFLFKHALAKVGGATKTGSPAAISNNSGLLVQLDIDKDGSESGGDKGANTVVTIKSIEIKSGQVEYDSNGDGTTETTGYVTGGQFNLATGKWGDIQTGSEDDAITHKITQAKTDDGSSAVLNTTIAEPTSITKMEIPSGKSDYHIYKAADDSAPVEGVLTTRKNVYSDEANPFVFIPGTKPSFTITVDYIVRTFDPNLATSAPGTGETGTWTKVEQVISKNVSFTEAVQLNKMYSLVMHLGLTGVKFTAEVSNWDVEGWTDTNDNNTVDDGEVELKETYLPINVQGETDKATITSGTDATVNVAATATTYSLTIDGITNTSTKLTFTKTGTGITAPSEESLSSDTNKTISVTLNANKTNKPVVNTLTVKEKNGDDVVKTSVITITQNPDKTYTLTPTVIGQTASSTGTITVSGGTVSSVTATTTPEGLTASVSSNVVTYTASNANETGNIKTFDGIVLTINDGTNDYVYTTSITQDKASE